MNSELKRLLAEAIKFNLQIVTKSSRDQASLKESLKPLVLPKFFALKAGDITVDLLVEPSYWTWLDNDQRLVSLNEERPCSCCFLYTACLRLFSRMQPVWISQFEFDENDELYRLYTYFYSLVDVEPVILLKKKIFIAYARPRRWLAHQIRTFLTQHGLIVFDYLVEPLTNDEQLITNLQSKLDEADAVIHIDDMFSRRSVYVITEADYVIDSMPNKIIPVRIGDHDKGGLDNGRTGTVYNYSHPITICTCHWPERLRELISWLFYVIKKDSSYN